jgi:hypothetical protein
VSKPPHDTPHVPSSVTEERQEAAQALRDSLTIKPSGDLAKDVLAYVAASLRIKMTSGEPADVAEAKRLLELVAALAPVRAEAEPAAAEEYDLSKLTTEELEQWAALADKARR